MSALSATAVRQLKDGTLADSQCPGLRLVASSAGKRWVIRYTDKHVGKLKQKTIGYYPRLTLTAARNEWMTFRAEQRAAPAPDPHADYTVRQLADDYINQYAKKLKRSWKEDERQLWKDLVEPWGTRPAAEITRMEVIDHLTEIAERGERAAQLFMAAARKAWNFAIRREKVQNNPFMQHKIIKGVVLHSDDRVTVEKKPRRWLNDDELKTFLEKLPTAGMRQPTRDILRLQLLTGTRKGECCALEWDQINTQTKVWTQPAEMAKNKTEHRVMLSKQAWSLLSAYKPREGYVFSSKAKGGHIRGDSVNDTLTSCLDHFGLKHWTPHALRHSAMTGLSLLGCSREIQDRISNHVDNSVGADYDHNPRDIEAREWLQKWADHLDGLTDG